MENGNRRTRTHSVKKSSSVRGKRTGVAQVRCPGRVEPRTSRPVRLLGGVRVVRVGGVRLAVAVVVAGGGGTGVEDEIAPTLVVGTDAGVSDIHGVVLVGPGPGLGKPGVHDRVPHDTTARVVAEDVPLAGRPEEVRDHLGESEGGGGGRVLHRRGVVEKVMERDGDGVPLLALGRDHEGRDARGHPVGGLEPDGPKLIRGRSVLALPRGIAAEPACTGPADAAAAVGAALLARARRRAGLRGAARGGDAGRATRTDDRDAGAETGYARIRRAEVAVVAGRAIRASLTGDVTRAVGVGAVDAAVRVIVESVRAVGLRGRAGAAPRDRGAGRVIDGTADGLDVPGTLRGTDRELALDVRVLAVHHVRRAVELVRLGADEEVGNAGACDTLIGVARADLAIGLEGMGTGAGGGITRVERADVRVTAALGGRSDAGPGRASGLERTRVPVVARDISGDNRVLAALGGRAGVCGADVPVVAVWRGARLTLTKGADVAHRADVAVRTGE